jgi:uncharacterized RmlC-like cupin family protein
MPAEQRKTWRDGVTVVRAAALDRAMTAPSGNGRATVFDFTGSGGDRTWVGMATVTPGSKTGTHNHGRHEVAIYVVKGRSQIRWGERLEFAVDIGPGDAVYFAPYVPHQEFNPHAEDTVYLVVRSDNERIVNKLDEKPVAEPETVC